MAKAKKRQVGHPARQAAAASAARERARSAEAARVAASRERLDGGCRSNCGCGDDCCS